MWAITNAILSHFARLNLFGGGCPLGPPRVSHYCEVQFHPIWCSETLINISKVYSMYRALLWNMLTIFYIEYYDFKHCSGYYLENLGTQITLKEKLFVGNGYFWAWHKALLNGLLKIRGHGPSGPQSLCPWFPYNFLVLVTHRRHWNL